VFPQADMLPAADVARIAGLLAGGAPDPEITAAAHDVRMRLNPHPAGQLALNIPDLDDEPLPGVQHNYPETVLVFPKQGQTCHAYCTYCFRWAQFVDEPELEMATADLGRVIDYLRQHREVTSVLITGGDPMIMGATVLRRYIEPLLGPGLEHIESVRIGSKSLAYWPQRFVSDPGPGSRPGGAAVFRALRPGRYLAHRPAARVRQPLPVRDHRRGPARALVPGGLRAGQLNWLSWLAELAGWLAGWLAEARGLRPPGRSPGPGRPTFPGPAPVAAGPP
jgi:hypothetical protein